MNLQKQKFIMGFKENLQTNKKRIYKSRNLLWVLKFIHYTRYFMHLQKQKFIMGFKEKKQKMFLVLIYKSRNLLWVLKNKNDRYNLLSTKVEIYYGF